MTIEEQLDRLNRTTWIVMTEPDVNKKWFNINITSILNDLYKDGYLICIGDKEHSYSVGELRAIDRLIAWITQISYAQEEIEDQIAAVVHLASKQSKRIMWVQHQALQNRRIYLERRSYKKYYKEILWALEKHESDKFKLITLPESFLVQENYLLDCIHLSEKGHRTLADILQKAFMQF